MQTALSRLRHRRPSATAAALAATFVTAVALTVPSAVGAHGGHHARAVPPPPAAPTSASQIQNIDQVKTAIKAYYGDTVTTTPDPVDGATMLHEFSPTGAYAKEVTSIARHVRGYLAARSHHQHGHHGFDGRPALIFDIDDTTLTTYDYEIYSNFVYNPTTNADFVNEAVFPATPGMVRLIGWARDHGYTVFFLTGRPETQRAGTLTNLTEAGYAPVSAKTFLKDQTLPWLTSCTPNCSSEQYKTLTRQHLEDTGYDVVANLGDQYSALRGGFAVKTVKIPNPMYFLP
jgi:hypothetical protein